MGVKYVFAEEVATEVVASGVVTATLREGCAWKPIYFTPGTASLNDDSTIEFQGEKIAYTFAMGIPGNDGALRHAVRAICGRPVVVALEYDDGDRIYCGGKDKKLRLKVQGKSAGADELVLGFEYASGWEFWYY